MKRGKIWWQVKMIKIATFSHSVAKKNVIQIMSALCWFSTGFWPFMDFAHMHADWIKKKTEQREEIWWPNCNLHA